MAEPLDPRYPASRSPTSARCSRGSALALALVAAGTTIGTVADIQPRLAARLVAVVPVVLGLAAALLGYRALAARRRRRARRHQLPPDRELRARRAWPSR